MNRVRVPLILALLLACGCATTGASDAEARAQRTLAGFREANPCVAELLDDAAAWAVFSAVEDTQAECRHEGILFLLAGGTRVVDLRCRARPAAPGGMAYHELVILMDPLDIARLEREALDLAGAGQLTAHEDEVVSGAVTEAATRWVVTTQRATLLFEPLELLQFLELSGGVSLRRGR